MQKDYAALLCGALVLSACSGGGGVPPVATAAPASLQTAAPACGGLLSVVQIKPMDDCSGNGNGESSSDADGDVLIYEGDGGYVLDGHATSLGGFDTSDFSYDFGDLVWSNGGFPNDQPATEYPRDAQCNAALATLNGAFASWLGWAFGTGGSFAIPGSGVLKVAGGVAIGAQAVAANITLQTAQNAVTIECSGQGAGLDPYGPLPSDYP
ncbi:MAG TPA: hypothetical protein VMB20_07330 [Candidatus Acidoferrum sp.]|nr:hypothetical protein [Candidatus Acidoferrum sp.]